MQNRSFDNSPRFPMIPVLRQSPNAIAEIKGSGEFPQISGSVRFYQTSAGVLVCSEICGLPKAQGSCGGRIFAFHIHDGDECSGNADDPFANAGKHYDRSNCGHPYHAGDMPPLFGNDGFALSVFLSNRFSVREVIGKVVIIHDKPDDFTTQPSGNAGRKIACGVIRPNNCRQVKTHDPL